jgi:hypothetical protein
VCAFGRPAPPPQRAQHGIPHPRLDAPDGRGPFAGNLQLPAVLGEQIELGDLHYILPNESAPPTSSASATPAVVTTVMISATAATTG